MLGENVSMTSKIRSNRRVVDANKQENVKFAAFNVSGKKMKVGENTGLKEMATFVMETKLTVITKSTELHIFIIQVKL